MHEELYKNLEKKELFLPLLNKFIERSVSENYINDTESSNSVTYADFYEKFVSTVAANNIENVFQFCESPIERIFLNSLQLLFVKNSMPCLFITSPFDDFETELINYRNYYLQFEDFITSYKEYTGDNELLNFEDRIKEKQHTGKMSEEEVAEILLYISIVKPFELRAYHITPQAGLPNLKVDNKSIRVDMLIWVPSDPSFKLIVECDGYAFHNSKDRFINDRIRDRILQENGYKVVRYSGSEINSDPASVSSNLYDMLVALDANWSSSRMV